MAATFGRKIGTAMVFESDFETDNISVQTSGWNLNKDEIFHYKIHVFKRKHLT